VSAPSKCDNRVDRRATTAPPRSQEQENTHRTPAINPRRLSDLPREKAARASGHFPCSAAQDKIAARLSRLVEQLGARHGLTRREMQVLEGTALGRTTKAVASDLLCSPKTVEEYWRRIYVRFKIASRQEIIALLLWESLRQLEIGSHSCPI
jgi:DNA-binding CsgD family transcriptional regulator